jgi:hypothetical protein
MEPNMCIRNKEQIFSVFTAVVVLFTGVVWSGAWYLLSLPFTLDAAVLAR